MLRSWAGESSAVIAGMLQDPASRANGEALLARADELLAASRAAGLADGSDLLPSGLTRRFASLAGALRAALAGARPGSMRTPTSRRSRPPPWPISSGRGPAWPPTGSPKPTRARRRSTPRCGWRAGWRTAPPSAGHPCRRCSTGTGSDAWVDSAVNDAAPGASDPDLGAGLAAVLAAVRARRAAHDVAFGRALAAHTSDDPPAVSGAHGGVRHLEELLPDVILPLARSAPVLLLVLDGMSAGVGAEVVASVLSRTADGWAEALLPGQARRAAALAVLPTLTEVSRASLLCGELRTGGQDVERRGYDALTSAYGLPGAALFHKKPLDSSRLGYAVADDVAAAIADVTGHPLVTCVLNTIDDALDRSDPGGTEWGADAVKHLAPLLDRARHAGRIVVLTADHGHIVERRQGTQRAYASISSGRSRAAIEPAGDGEVLVTGRRVLRHEGRAVLAVDEHLRYGPLKAGYHGGGAPAEAVVPVTVLVPGAVPEGVDLHLAPPQEPAWWIDPVAPVAAKPVDPGWPLRRAPRVPLTRTGPRRRPQDAAAYPVRRAGRQSPRRQLAAEAAAQTRPAGGPVGGRAEVRRLYRAEEDRRAGIGHRRAGPRAARRAAGAPPATGWSPPWRRPRSRSRR